MPPPPYQPRVLFEDNHLLVIDKPALLPTMGAEQDSPSLYHWAGDFLKKKYNKPGNAFVGVVSRLDSFVTGLIVLAKTSKAASRLSDQIRRNAVGKHYVALLPQGLSPASGTFEDRLYKDESAHRMRVAASDTSVRGEKVARLTYSTLMERDGIQAVEITLETGRKHQIRVQFENAGFPIIGDRKYGSNRRFDCGIALHCFQLRFEHPTLRTLQSFQATPPDYWPLQPLSKRKIQDSTSNNATHRPS